MKKESFAKNLQEVIRNSGIRQTIIANALGISSAAVSQFTHGIVLPSEMQLSTLLALLCIPEMQRRELFYKLELARQEELESFNAAGIDPDADPDNDANDDIHETVFTAGQESDADDSDNDQDNIPDEEIYDLEDVIEAVSNDNDPKDQEDETPEDTEKKGTDIRGFEEIFSLMSGINSPKKATMRIIKPGTRRRIFMSDVPDEGTPIIPISDLLSYHPDMSIIDFANACSHDIVLRDFGICGSVVIKAYGSELGLAYPGPLQFTVADDLPGDMSIMSLRCSVNGRFQIIIHAEDKTGLEMFDIKKPIPDKDLKWEIPVLEFTIMPLKQIF